MAAPRTVGALPRTVLAAVAAVLLIPASLGLAGCAETRAPGGSGGFGGSGTSVEAGIDTLHTALTSIDGVDQARVTTNTDGSPVQRRLNVVLYVSDLSADAVTPVVADALQEAWHFDAFTPVGYAIEVWPAPVPEPPVDYDDMFDLETILTDLDLGGGYVYDRQLALDADVLEARFGPRG
ncbi:hypothetical protein [Cryobacterium melibiosiphilum]|nr:hypothetical protein [Cryobacterium melibiosiphilum]